MAPILTATSPMMFFPQFASMLRTIFFSMSPAGFLSAQRGGFSCSLPALSAVFGAVRVSALVTCGLWKVLPSLQPTKLLLQNRRGFFFSQNNLHLMNFEKL
ncbi:hypothetical protein OJAV_G00093000 [Oryzias javanicus]|uniref:Uncharacterized protein n=1 Tax=Oryzias javanicus TaxID=123683 RepID=A0A437D129_ORYJA|nr:hypothetical protein OJAV_G00093000 [Oryzias javanicus]